MFLSYIFALLLLLIRLWFTFDVLEVLCENKSTNAHSTQFMVRTEEGSVLYLYTKFEADNSIRSKNIRFTQISKLGHVTPVTPTWGSFMVHTQEVSILYVCTKFEADIWIRSKDMKVPKFRNWVTLPQPRPLRGRFMVLPFSMSVPDLKRITL